MGWIGVNDSTPEGIVLDIGRTVQILLKKQIYYNGIPHLATIKTKVTVTTTEYRGMTKAKAEAVAGDLASSSISQYHYEWTVGTVTWFGIVEVETGTQTNIRRANDADGYSVIVVAQTAAQPTHSEDTGTLTLTALSGQ